MKKPRNRILFAFLVMTFVSGHFASLLSAGVEDVRVMNHLVTSAKNLRHAKRTAMKRFSLQDSIWFWVPLTWDSRKTSLGKHAITWNWYVGNKLAFDEHQASGTS
jgi:hypothetical protein